MQRLIRQAALLCLVVTSSSAWAANAKLINPKVDTSKTGVVIPTDEQAYLERLHQANQSEIALGEIAADRATTPAIRDFAKTMVKAHVEADNSLMAYAKSQNLKLGAPQPLDDTEAKVMNAHKAQLDALTSLTGEAFDQAYLTELVRSHDLMLTTLLEGQKQFAQTDLAPMLTKLVPEVRMHRAHAYKLLGTVTPKLS